MRRSASDSQCQTGGETIQSTSYFECKNDKNAEANKPTNFCITCPNDNKQTILFSKSVDHADLNNRNNKKKHAPSFPVPTNNISKVNDIHKNSDNLNVPQNENGK